MTKKIDVTSLPEFNAASFMADYEDIKAYIRVVKEEGDPVALGEALKTIFMALGACVVADALKVMSKKYGMRRKHPWSILRSCSKSVM